MNTNTATRHLRKATKFFAAFESSWLGTLPGFDTRRATLEEALRLANVAEDAACRAQWEGHEIGVLLDSVSSLKRRVVAEIDAHAERRAARSTTPSAPVKPTGFAAEIDLARKLGQL